MSAQGRNKTFRTAAIPIRKGSSGVYFDDAVAAIDGYYAEALDPNEGEFLMPVVGVLDNPFAVA